MPALNKIKRRFARLRHLRGHGVHSPFVYSMVRTAFMGRTVAEPARPLYDTLRRAGVCKKTARQVANMHVFCGAPRYAINSGEGLPGPAAMKIFLPDAGGVETAVGRPESFFVVIAPGRRIRKVCDKIASDGGRLSIDKRGFYVFFPAATEPHQHFRL